MSFEEVKKKFPKEFEERGRDLANFRPPEGESFADLKKRAWPAFKKIVVEEKGNIVIVAHAGVNRVVLSHLLGKSLQDMFEIRQNHAHVNIIENIGDKWKVIEINKSLTEV
jgi:alpha-ribazole phosphatase